MGIITFFCLATFNNVPLSSVSHIDKAVHAFFYVVLTILLYQFFKNYLKGSGLKAMWFSFIAAILYGIIIEIAQDKLTATRHADMLDVVANAAGAFIGILCIYVFSLLQTSKSQKISQ